MVEVDFDLSDLSSLRRLVTTTALGAGLSMRRAGDFALAANEIATNAVVHGRPPATLRLWTGTDEIVCEVADSGSGIDDTRAGELRPAADVLSGRGLWLARQLCDAVEIRNGVGCTVSLHATIPAG